MEQNSTIYRTYVEILKKELVPAFGCTEPTAIAFCAAKTREILGVMPERVQVEASGNIIKNVKSVVVPNTDGMRGIEAAAAAGILYGDSARGLEVIASAKKEDIEKLPDLLNHLIISLRALHTEHVLEIRITMYAGEHSAMVHIADEHTRIIEIMKDGEALMNTEQDISDRSDGVTAQDASDRSDEDNKVHPADTVTLDYSLLNVKDIVDFADCADLSDVHDIIKRQIKYNTAIAREGLRKKYGACIGQVLMHHEPTLRTKAKAMPAAGSDARMNGCDLPVVINSGSGNQGLTASLPVITYADYYEKDKDSLYRALLVSNLVTLHLKSGIGRLSAYCGAVSAGAGAGAGIAYLMTGDLDVINHTIVNALAVTSGIVCDGAKASCAAKIAMSVEAGILGFEMYQEGNEFYGGDGLVSTGVENTIRNISVLGHDGMQDTDKKIIEIMCEKC